MTQTSLTYMKRALSLARRGAGRVSPNPMVGAVLVRNGKVVGEGFHLYSRKLHAEVIALDQAGELARGADLYVSLEPCCHQGRTPPCTERIIEAGVHRVFVAMEDPNPKVRGRGIRRLRQAGIVVDSGILESDALRLNEKFACWILSGRPFVTLKLAATLDGRIATRDGESKWVTGPEARKAVHRLRFEHDAVLVGVGTVLRDDPSLDVRWRVRKRILKVVLDSRLRTPPEARLFESGDRVLIFHSEQAPKSRRKLFKSRPGLELVELPAGQAWEQILQKLGEKGVGSLLIEGGSRVATTAFHAGIVHKLELFLAPRVLGGEHLPLVQDLGIDKLTEALPVKWVRHRAIGPDLWISGYFHDPEG